MDKKIVAIYGLRATRREETRLIIIKEYLKHPNMSIDDLAIECRLSRGSIFNHFKDADNLRAEALRYFILRDYIKDDWDVHKLVNKIKNSNINWLMGAWLSLIDGRVTLEDLTGVKAEVYFGKPDIKNDINSMLSKENFIAIVNELY